MFKISEKRVLNSQVTWMTIEAPFIARKVQPGQFVIVRIDEKGESIYKPFVDWCPELDKKLSLLGIYLYNLRLL